MQIKVTEVIYKDSSEPSQHPDNFIFEIEDSICSDDNKLSAEVYKLIKDQTGHTLIECTIQVD